MTLAFADPCLLITTKDLSPSFEMLRSTGEGSSVRHTQDGLSINERTHLLSTSSQEGTRPIWGLAEQRSVSMAFFPSATLLSIAMILTACLYLQNSLIFSSLLQDLMGLQRASVDDVSPLVSVVLDPSLTFTVSSCVNLLYSQGADISIDRPSHLRAASSMQWITDDRLAIVQDDSNFIALLDIQLTTAEEVGPPVLSIKDAFSIALPDSRGSRQFSKDLGNKSMKLDLEASIYVPKDWSPLEEGFFLGFGSGSSSVRNVIIMVRDSLLLSDAHVDVDFQPVNASFWETYCGHDLPKASNSPILAFHAPELYQSMRDYTAFSGSELNVEGAAFLPNNPMDTSSRIRFFQRGNGAADPKRGLDPVSATAEVVASEASDVLAISPPKLLNVMDYNLGSVDGVSLTFTGSAPSASSETFVYIAGAEASPDATRDGAVVGTAMGFIRPFDVSSDGTISDGSAVYNFLTHPNGTKFLHKTEGVAVTKMNGGIGAHKKGTALTVLDMDDPSIPSQMCVVAIS